MDSHGFVFVADCYNYRVRVLSPTLTRLGDVNTPEHRLNLPFDLHLDELNARLYVGHHRDVVVISSKHV